MTFAEYLTQLTEEYGISKNRLIRETGIDRSSFFQFLKGTRKPTGRQLLQIGLAAGFQKEERRLLHELYVKEKYGEETFRLWEKIRETINRLDTMTLDAPKDDFIFQYLKQVCDGSGSKKTVRFDLFLPVSIVRQSSIFDGLAALIRSFSGTISARMIVVDFSDRNLPDGELIELFMQGILLHKEPRVDISLYHYHGNYQRSDLPLVGYPFFILSDSSFMMINDLSNDCKILRDMDFLRKHAVSFEEFLRKCSPLSIRNGDLTKQAEYLEMFFPSSDDDLVYTVECLPCVYRYAPLEMVTKYAPPAVADIAVPYVSAMKTAFHLKQYFNPDGFNTFRRDCMLYDAGMNIQLSKEDAEILSALMLEQTGKDVFFSDPSRFRMSEQWHIASGRKALLFTSCMKNVLVSVTSRDPQICGAFYRYFSHLDEDGSEFPPEAVQEYIRKEYQKNSAAEAL